MLLITFVFEFIFELHESPVGKIALVSFFEKGEFLFMFSCSCNIGSYELLHAALLTWVIGPELVFTSSGFVDASIAKTTRGAHFESIFVGII
jgi:hypothetical protein